MAFREEAELIVTAEEVGARHAKTLEGILAGYDPNPVAEAIRETAGSWADVDVDAVIAAIYRARLEETRPPSRP